MFNLLFPKIIDNDFRGQKPALWLFGALAVLKLIMGVNISLNGRNVAQQADRIPLERFTPDGAQTVVALFSLMGVTTLMIAALCLLVLARYRAMVPLMFTLLLLEFMGRTLVGQLIPIVRTSGQTAGIVHGVLFSLMAAGLVLSLWERKSKKMI